MVLIFRKWVPCLTLQSHVSTLEIRCVYEIHYSFNHETSLNKDFMCSFLNYPEDNCKCVTFTEPHPCPSVLSQITLSSPPLPKALTPWLTADMTWREEQGQRKEEFGEDWRFPAEETQTGCLVRDGLLPSCLWLGPPMLSRPLLPQLFKVTRTSVLCTHHQCILLIRLFSLPHDF